MGFQVYVTKDKKQMSQVAAQIVLGQILSFIPTEEKEKMVLGLATGSTPMGLYDIIASNQYLFDAQRIASFNLDEYVGLRKSEPDIRRATPILCLSSSSRNSRLLLLRPLSQKALR